ncbi:MAG: terpene cyclase/mutase family protein [Planctomycetes bacterium]|nr:terpene cyclase/mutase family protein [Planctomycetota bacterium]
MAPRDTSDEKNVDPQVDEELEEEQEEVVERPGWLKETPFWAISAILHMILFVILLQFITEVPEPKAPQLPVKIRPVPKKREDKYDPTLKRDILKTPKIPDPRLVEKTVIQRKLDEVTPEIPKGTDLNNLTNVELLNSSIHDAIGVGGGAAGAYGERWGKGSLISEGGSEGTESAVRAALEWLRRHQGADGSWKCHDFTEMCKKPCANVNTKYGDGRGWKGHDIGVTGLAILAFAGFGHTHQDGVYHEYVECLKKAVKFLKSVQVHSEDPSANGRYGDDKTEQWIYDHAIATMAMGELLAMSNDTIGLKKTVTDAVRLCMQAQNPGYGWKYGIKPGKNDTSVTGWMVLALKTAKNARLDLPKERFEEAFKGSLVWFDRATSVASGKTGYESPGDEGSALKGEYPEPYPFSKELSCMTAVGVLCRLFAGQSRSDPIVKRGVDILMKEPPQWVEPKGTQLSKINMYYWYYGSYALFQYGGKPWKDWNEDMKKALLSTQRQGDIDEDGSWDPIDEWGKAGGRVYATALGAMTLEVYYRFIRAQQGIGL